MIMSRSELIKSFLPNAVLIPITSEAEKSILDMQTINKLVPMFEFPFKVGRESRMSENDRGLFVKLRILNNVSKPNNDIYLVNNTESLEISKEHFQIEKKDDIYLIKDRNSTLGTKLNDKEIGKDNANKSYILEDKDIIKIGSSDSKYEFQFLILK
ncbi:FHA domain-containing protein [Arcobacter sp. s6]|uniref:FHA domain-containing protein n=1 Tax=Arcobacter sp. s6 TaxID=3230363 RepID=UPI0034A0824F